jgi:hypothetical protein
MHRALRLVPVSPLQVATMRATKAVLLITADKRAPKVMETDLLEGEIVVDIFRSLLTKNLQQGIVYTPDMTCATITDVSFAGLAGPKAFGLPLSMYLILLVVGIFTLSIPVCLRLGLSQERPVKVCELIQLLTHTIRKNPNYYTGTSVGTIERRLRRAKTFDQIRRALE